MKKPILVVKFGTSSITDVNGNIDESLLKDVVRQVSELNTSYHIIMVSSGAVGTGKKYIKEYKGSIKERKAAAAIGNPILINNYSKLFAEHGIVIAQTLLERRHFSKRKNFLQLRETVEQLWHDKIIPIANENDVVSDLELKFSDNDHLACLLATGFGADKLLIATSVPGILDTNKNVIPLIEDSDLVLKQFITKEKSALGLGGMTAKLSYAKLAATLGIRTVIFGLKTENAIFKALEGVHGSTFLPNLGAVSSLRLKWLGSGSISNGAVEVDKGAKDAIKARKSLLSVGVISITGSFSEGEVFDITHHHKIIAVAVSKLRSNEVIIGENNKNQMLSHADDILII